MGVKTRKSEKPWRNMKKKTSKSNRIAPNDIEEDT
jgi:hypothetical protein